MADLLVAHFGPALRTLRVSSLEFPFRVRPDLQRAIEKLLADDAVTVRRFCGVRKQGAYDGIEFDMLTTSDGYSPAVVVPPQYEYVDIGEEASAQCLETGLWLLEREGIRHGILMTPVYYGPYATSIRFQMATSDDAAGTELVNNFFRAVQTAVSDARSYRGKVLSLESSNNYSGLSKGIKVHRLRTVPRNQVILSKQTLDLLDRNVLSFVQRRQRLAAHGQSTKKGLLFYGPPGTGKSHTIHYLAGALKGHTTLLITAEQVALLDEYFALARLLQPSLMVIEDVDLIARRREDRSGPCDESLLNKILNEMDGLRESADILFILTTNRPQTLEAALASRPGRVDQAIEFPLPDAEGRRKLIRLYADRTLIADHVIEAIVRRTEKVSAAFIKELMRRSIQFMLERDGKTETIELVDVENALTEMLFTGGSLNAALLGAAGATGTDIGGTGLAGTTASTTRGRQS